MWSSGSRTEERCKVRRPHSTLGSVFLKKLLLHWKNMVWWQTYFCRNLDCSNMKQSEKNTLGKFWQMINICFLLGFFGEWDWWAKNCELNFHKAICPIAAGLYRQIQFTVQLRKLNSPSHPAVQQMWIKTRYLGNIYEHALKMKRVSK